MKPDGLPEDPRSLACAADNQARARCRSEDCLKGLKLARFSKVPCDQFLMMGLRYQHTDPPSPDKDYVTIKLELRDLRSGGVYRVAGLLQRRGHLPDPLRPSTALSSPV